MASMDQYSIVLTFGFVGLALVVFRLSRIGRRPANYPPGPPTLPILGNIHQASTMKYPRGVPHINGSSDAQT